MAGTPPLCFWMLSRPVYTAVYTALLSFHPTDLPFVSSMALVVGLPFLVF